MYKTAIYNNRTIIINPDNVDYMLETETGWDVHFSNGNILYNVYMSDYEEQPTHRCTKCDWEGPAQPMSDAGHMFCPECRMNIKKIE
jgi:hypothetical protein